MKAFLIVEFLGLVVCIALTVISALTDAALFERTRSNISSLLANSDSPGLQSFWDEEFVRLDITSGLLKLVGFVGGAFATYLLTYRVLERLNSTHGHTLRLLIFGISFSVYIVGLYVYPKRLGVKYPDTWLPRGLSFVKLLHRGVWPLTRLLEMALPLPRWIENGDQSSTTKDVAESDSAQSPNPDHEKLLESVFEFPDTLVREVMVPRTDMVVLSDKMELAEILDILVECGHSRIPVCSETMDDVIGLFYAKDLLSVLRSDKLHDFDIQDFLREPYLVPENKPIGELLTEFQEERKHMAIVVDEFGGTAGLITLEDIIEEIFGEIQDEYDADEVPEIQKLDESTYRASATIAIDKLEEELELDFPENHEYESLAGFLLSQMGSVPLKGDELNWNGLSFEVLEADSRRIISVLIRREGATE